jgi:uncharacterized membrane protein SpoIIM required for sporulation
MNAAMHRVPKPAISASSRIFSGVSIDSVADKSSTELSPRNRQTTLNVNEFIKTRERDWQRLEALVVLHKSNASLSASEVRELGLLYRSIISDLALARRDFPNQRVTLFLNQLLTRTHSFIYQRDASDLRPLAQYFTRQVPTTFRQTAIYTIIAFLLFIIPAVVGYHLTEINPNVADVLGLSDERTTLANQAVWTNIPVESRPYASAFIMGNNIRLSIFAFAGGVSFGIFTVYILTTNGLIIGAIMGLATHYGMGTPLLTFIIGHGVIELSVVFIAGGAGLQLAWSLINPGIYSRRDALAVAAQRAVTLATAAIPLLVIAGLIEGFISPTSLPFPIHAAIGLVMGVFLYGYLTLVGVPPKIKVRIQLAD